MINTFRGTAKRTLGAVAIVAALSMGTMMSSAFADQNVTTPMEEFGHNIGDDYKLINYTQFEKYFRKLAKESPRMIVEEIGKTAQGRGQLMATITAPKNFAKLAEYKAIAQKLARAEDITDAEAHAYSKTSKAVVWIDGGLHATEVVGAHQLTELAYTLVSREDEETMRFLDDLIILLTHANPDGMELVSDWYMRKKDEKKRNHSDIPTLYQHYVGHDNNRDFYMMEQNETTNIANQLFRQWYPVAMYNHHQTGPSGQMVFIPPFGGPTNHNINGEVTLGNQAVGLAMHTRLVREGKGGSAMFENGPYTEWSNGILRASAYYHNMIGILTEIHGNPTPQDVPFFPELQLKNSKYPLPWKPGKLHFRTAIDYSLTQNYALLDFVSRNADTLMYNRYKMGKKAIDMGNTDSWTMRPNRIYDLESKIAKDDPKAAKDIKRSRGSKGVDMKYYADLQRPEDRDPRGYVIPRSQADFPSAVKFVNALMKGGVDVLKATRDFKVNGKSYKAGSFVVQSAQAYRAQVLDLFEPQDHPNDMLYPGGPPVRPYDNAGWTLALQMGVEFDRQLDGFDGPFEKIAWAAKVPAGSFAGSSNAAGYTMSHDVVNSVIAVNRLLADGDDVYWLTQDTNAGPAGTIYMKADAGKLQKLSTELGLNIEAISSEPKASALKLNPVRVGLWDRYGGSMPSGWTRWILEKHEFTFRQVFAQEMDKGKLDKKFDAIVFVQGAIPAVGKPFKNTGRGSQPEAKSIPREFRSTLGFVSEDKTIPELAKFVKGGDTIITIGSSTRLANHFGLPVKNHLTGRTGKPLGQDDFYIPPSILDMKVDSRLPIAYGIGKRAMAIHAGSPVFRFGADYDTNVIKPIAWFDHDSPLKSGWAWGQERLFGGTSMVEASVGKGKLFMFGPEILFRAQSQSNFQFFFNGLYLSNAKEVTLGN
jgi:hypothetical protein